MSDLTPAASGKRPLDAAGHADRNQDGGVRSAVTYLTVAADQSGQRIDNYLLSALKGVPKSWIYRALRTGQIRVDGGRARADRRLVANQRVRVPPVVTGRRPVSQVTVPSALAARLEAGKLYQDEDLLVVDKPSGLAVHGGSGQSLGLIEALRALWPSFGYLELVHRLDKETSGCLLLARRRSILRSLHLDLRTRAMDKRYVTLVKGRWASERELFGGLSRSKGRGGERIVRIDEQGKSAVTVFRPLQPGVQASLLEVFPQTGRTHQIRVHAAAAGHPIAGDSKYGHHSFNLRMRELGLRRLFLHAAGLRFAHPQTGESILVQAPAPPELSRLTQALGLTAPIDRWAQEPHWPRRIRSPNRREQTP